jgi:hypothetical protein
LEMAISTTSTTSLQEKRQPAPTACRVLPSTNFALHHNHNSETRTQQGNTLLPAPALRAVWLAASTNSACRVLTDKHQACMPCMHARLGLLCSTTAFTTTAQAALVLQVLKAPLCNQIQDWTMDGSSDLLQYHG